jgi:hypothetical protein
MTISPTALGLLAIVILAIALVALCVAACAAVLSRLDGATLPAAVQRAAVAFAGTVTLLVAVLALVAGALR